QAGLLAAGVVILQALLVMWFAWPAQKTAPRDLPVVVAGRAPAATAVADTLRAERPGAFDISTVPDAATADQVLRDTEAYAGFVVASSGRSVHSASSRAPRQRAPPPAFLIPPTPLALPVASAASPAVATLLTQAVQHLGNGRSVQV